MTDYNLILPRELSDAATAATNGAIPLDDGSAVVKVTPKKIVDAGRPFASQAQAEAGTDATVAMSPLTTKQAIEAVVPAVVQPYVEQAEAWAESATPPDPGIPDSKSAKTWAHLAEDAVDRAEAARDEAEGYATETAALGGVWSYASLAAFNAASIPAHARRVEVSTPYGTLSFIRGASVAGIRSGWRPDGDFDPGHFGADYSGVNDSSDALQACFDAAQGEFPISTLPGKLRINYLVTPRYSNQTVDFGDTEIDASAFTGWTFTNIGWNTGRNRAVIEPRGEMIANDRLVTVAIDDGAASITLDSAAGIEPGDIITLLSSGELWYTYTEGMPVYKAEVNRVLSVNGNVVRLSFPASFSYSLTGHTVTATIVRPITNIMVKGGRWYGGGVRGNITNGFGPCAVSPEGVVGFTFSPKYVEGFQNKVLAPLYCLDWAYKDATVQGLSNDYSAPLVEDENSCFYNVFSSWCRFGLVDNVSGTRTRNLVDGTYSYDVEVMSCTPINTHRSAFTCHHGCDRWIFHIGTVVNVTRYGIHWRGFNVLFVDGDIDVREVDLRNYGITVLDSGPNDLYRTVVFNNVKCRSTRPAIQVSATNLERVELINCEFSCTEGAPVRVLSPRFRSFVVRGGRYVSSGTQIFQFQETSLQNVGATIDIQGAILEGYNVSPVRIFDTATGTNVICKGNTLRPASGGELVPTVAYGNRASGIWDIGPNYRWGGYVDSGPLPSTTVSVKIGGDATGITLGNNNLWFTRDNNTIQFSAYVALTSKGDSIGALSIDGLPGAASALGASALALRLNNVDPSLDNTNIFASIQGGTNEIRIYKMVAGVEVRLTDADIKDNTSFWISGSYRLQYVMS